ncbi:hypothetical protein GCM10010269_06550 [Streptomyces humidus]|uniref:Uncharacterized protein n=1 Tax=Streptomyces humidus TaxID=52259 RepID=A0A918FRB4_9ACTN|nr:hypothetical protein GCM10010269_06550 [Streptomyces humidus]
MGIVVRRVLAGHALIGPCADHRAVETVTRVAPDGARPLFPLDHGSTSAHVSARAPADLLTG